MGESFNINAKRQKPSLLVQHSSTSFQHLACYSQKLNSYLVLLLNTVEYHHLMLVLLVTYQQLQDCVHILDMTRPMSLLFFHPYCAPSQQPWKAPVPERDSRHQEPEQSNSFLDCVHFPHDFLHQQLQSVVKWNKMTWLTFNQMKFAQSNEKISTFLPVSLWKCFPSVLQFVLDPNNPWRITKGGKSSP